MCQSAPCLVGGILLRCTAEWIVFQGTGGALAETYPENPSDVFQPMEYLGRWYEIASLKQGFAGEGQQDCHCTQGIYQPRDANGSIGLTVNTFCFHGGPNGRISGIQG